MWDTKYRPLLFSDILGQEGNVQLLKSRLKNGTAFSTSYIFGGPYGTGKTTISRIFARAMLCLNLDKSTMEPCNQCENCKAILAEQPGPFVERDAASHGTIEYARSIVEELAYSLANAPKRIYLFDEAHRMSMAAQDVLLKPIEDKKMIGIFCTTEIEKIRGAIRSRCEEYLIRKITREDIFKRMRVILESEKVNYQEEAVYIVIDYSGGHVRDVINKLEMISQLGAITIENVREYLQLSTIPLYYKILLHLDNPVQALELVDKACEQVSPEEVASGIAEAAMNTYRLANNVHVDFSFVDKTLASQVYDRYKSDVIKFTHWFLNSKHTSKLSLAKDVLCLSHVPKNLPVEQSAPVVVPAVVVPVAVVSSPVVSAPSTPTPTPVPTPTPHIENFADPLSPTEIESFYTRAPLPRTRKSPDNAVLKRKRRIKEKNLSPDEWRRKFEYAYKRKKEYF